MNRINMQRGAGLLILLCALGLMACTDKNTSTSAAGAAPATAANAASGPSVVGTEPAGPTKEAPATTSNAKSDVTKAQQSSAMPMDGQVNDHSTLSPQATQKSGSGAR